MKVEESKFIAENVNKELSQVIKDYTKSLSMIDSGRRITSETYKAGKDFARGNNICRTLCCNSIGYEGISNLVVWCLISGVMVTVLTLKCKKLRGLCAEDPSSPFY